MDKKETVKEGEGTQGHESVHFSPWALWKSGIQPSHTLLSVGTYNLACVPYQVSMERAILLGSFTQDEIVFFQRFKGSLAGLGVIIQKPGESKPTKIFCRCQIETIGLMKGRDRVGLISLGFKPIPPDLALVIEEHFLSFEYLKGRFESLSRRPIQLSPENARVLGYGSVSHMAYEGAQQKVALYSLAVDLADFLLPLSAPKVEEGKPVVLTPFFQRYRFSVRGGIESVETMANGVQRVKARLEFSAELVQLVSEYFEGGGMSQVRNQIEGSVTKL